MALRYNPWNGKPIMFYHAEAVVFDWFLAHPNTFYTKEELAEALGTTKFKTDTFTSIRIKLDEPRLPRHFVRTAQGYAYLTDGNDPRNHIRERWGVVVRLTQREFELWSILEEIPSSEDAVIPYSLLCTQLHISTMGLLSHLKRLRRVYGSCHIILLPDGVFLKD